LNDHYLDSSSSLTPSTSTFLNHLDDEIDLLIDETTTNRPSSSAFENLSSWHNDYFQQRHFYPNFFPTDTTLPMLSSSTNIDTDNSTNSFTSNPLTFM
jgi:hypothetical protein